MTTQVQNIVCMCIRCMDHRLNSEKMHGLTVFIATNAGASVKPDSRELPSNALASFMLLDDKTASDNEFLITSQSGHYDCLDVKRIWEAATGVREITQRYERRLYPPYIDLALQVQSMGLDRTKSLRLLSAAKTLFDMNNMFTYPEVMGAIKAQKLKFVVHYEDPTTKPYRLLIYDFAAGQYTELNPPKFSFLKWRYTKPGGRLLDLKRNLDLLYQYEVPRAIDVNAFVIAEAKRLRDNTSILLPENSKRDAATKFVSSLTRENARYTIKYVRRAGRVLARHSLLRHIL